VIVNPAGRFAFADIVESKATPVAIEKVESTFKGSCILRLPCHQTDCSSMVSTNMYPRVGSAR
jgi:hypothetical protein